jgi:hypothetical protein
MNTNKKILSVMMGLALVAGGFESSALEPIRTLNQQQPLSLNEIVRTHSNTTVENLNFIKKTESLLGSHYYYQQSLFGTPIEKAILVVSLGNRGELMRVVNQTMTISKAQEVQLQKLLQPRNQIGHERALDIAWSNMKVQHELLEKPTSVHVWYSDKGQLRLANKVQITAKYPTGGFIQYLDAYKGSLIAAHSTTKNIHSAELVAVKADGKNKPLTIDARKQASGPVLDRRDATSSFAAKEKARVTLPPPPMIQPPPGEPATGYVFDPDPRSRLRSDNLEDNSGSASFDAAYDLKVLNGVVPNSNGVYKLSGPYVNIKNIPTEVPLTEPTTTRDGKWRAKRGSSGFDDTNVYFHIDQSQRYIQSLGFRNIWNRPIDVDTDGEDGDDNSHFQPISDDFATSFLSFGHGCVNDSEDAGVILHEYGHAIQDDIFANGFYGGDSGAIGEGFGDYWATSYVYSTANGQAFHPDRVFKWDGFGTLNACGGGRYVNRTNLRYDPNKTYDAHVTIQTIGNQRYQSDELWSTPLVEAMKSLLRQGKRRADIDKIVLEGQFGLPSDVTMPQMAQSIVDAAARLFPNSPEFSTTFREKFVDQNILKPATVVLQNNVAINGIKMANGDTVYYKIAVPSGKKTLTVSTNGSASEDIDIFVDLNSKPTTKAGTYLKASTGGTTTEKVVIARPASGTYYILLRAYSKATNVTLRANFE